LLPTATQDFVGREIVVPFYFHDLWLGTSLEEVKSTRPAANNTGVGNDSDDTNP